MGPKHKEWDTSIGAWVVKGQSQGKQWVATRASGQPHRKESCLSYSAARSGEGSPFTAPSPAAAPSPDPGSSPSSPADEALRSGEWTLAEPQEEEKVLRRLVGSIKSSACRQQPPQPPPPRFAAPAASEAAADEHAPREETAKTSGGRSEEERAADGSGATDSNRHKREGRSLVWKAFDRDNGRCMLPHPTRPGEVCGSSPLPGSGAAAPVTLSRPRTHTPRRPHLARRRARRTAPPAPLSTGTSGHLRHLERDHREAWLHIKQTGEPMSASTPSVIEEVIVDVIEDAVAESRASSRTPSVVDEHKPADRKQCGTPGCELTAWHKGVCQSYQRVGPRQRPPSSVLFSSVGRREKVGWGAPSFLP